MPIRTRNSCDSSRGRSASASDSASEATSRACPASGSNSRMPGRSLATMAMPARMPSIRDIGSPSWSDINTRMAWRRSSDGTSRRSPANRTACKPRRAASSRCRVRSGPLPKKSTGVSAPIRCRNRAAASSSRSGRLGDAMRATITIVAGSVAAEMWAVSTSGMPLETTVTRCARRGSLSASWRSCSETQIICDVSGASNHSMGNAATRLCQAFSGLNANPCTV